MTPTTPANALSTVPPTKRAPADSRPREVEMWFVRESDESDRVLFDSMRQKTYAGSRHRPEIAAVLDAGMTPLSGVNSFEIERELPDGSTARDTVVVEHFARGTTKAVLFSYAGSWHLWSMASAARISDEGVNDITQILGEVLRRLRPRVMYAHSISRLIRDQNQSNILATYLNGTVDRIITSEATLDLVGPNSKVGWLLYQLLAMIAATERDWIAARLQAGRVAKWRRGEWPLAASMVPYGYALDPQTQRLAPDDAAREQIGELLRLLASGLPPAVMLTKIGELGLTLNSRDGAIPRPVGRTRNPRGKLEQLYRHVAVWASGEYLLRMENLAPGASDIGGAPVVRLDAEDVAGELQLLHHFPVPQGGWADPDVLAAAQRAAIAWFTKEAARNGRLRPLAPAIAESSAVPALLAVAGTRAHRVGKAGPAKLTPAARGRRESAVLAGRTWQDTSSTYELRVHDTEQYDLMRFTRPDASQESHS